jgi:hypothetical protein
MLAHAGCLLSSFAPMCLSVVRASQSSDFQAHVELLRAIPYRRFRLRGHRSPDQIRHDDILSRSKLNITSARWKAAAALYCANVLRPDLDETGKRKLVNEILTVADRQDRTIPRPQIMAAAVEEMFFQHAQCIYPKCPLLLFSKQLADELNQFFNGEGE